MPLPACRSIACMLILSAAAVVLISCRGKQANLKRAPVQAIPTQTASDEAPPAPREFRAAWVATVGNIDWPSRPGLSAEQQQQEITQMEAILTRLSR